MALSAPSFCRFGSITGISKSGAKQTLEFEEDQNLFEVLTGAGVIPSEGTCAGNLACGKCRIRVASGKVPAAEDEEKELLEGTPCGTRLACAIVLNSDCNGAVFEEV